MTTGAPPALRGYRLQHLYTLFRLLTDAARGGYSIQLEGPRTSRFSMRRGSPEGMLESAVREPGAGGCGSTSCGVRRDVASARRYDYAV